jgi:hypothetical protein
LSEGRRVSNWLSEGRRVSDWLLSKGSWYLQVQQIDSTGNDGVRLSPVETIHMSWSPAGSARAAEPVDAALGGTRRNARSAHPGLLLF